MTVETVKFNVLGCQLSRKIGCRFRLWATDEMGFIFPHFSRKTLTNINIQHTHRCDNIYLRCKNK